MRGLIGLGLVGLLAVVAIIYVTVGMGTEGDNSTSVAVGYGKVPSGSYEMHIGVEFVMLKTESPTLRGKSSTWPEWVEEHFKVADDKGKTVPLTRTNNSRLMKGQGTWDFYLSAPAKPGAIYEITYKPRRAEPKCYKQKFKIPETGQKMVRITLKAD
jgi:hypothetical protein